MGSSAEKSEQCVLLVVDACSDTRPLVDLAVGLAREIGNSRDTHLQGLFIEDEDLLSIADLPCSQEISQHTAIPRSTSREQMLELYRRQSDRFKYYLGMQADASRLGWSYISRACHTTERLFIRDIMATCRIYAKPLTRLVSQRHGARVYRVVVLENQSPLMLQVLQTVVRRLAGQRLEITLVHESGAAGMMTEMLQSLRAWQPEFPLLRVHACAREDLDALLADPPRCDYVILSQRENRQIQRAVNDRLDCCLLVID